MVKKVIWAKSTGLISAWNSRWYKPTDRGVEWMGDREVWGEGEKDEDQGWYPNEIEQSLSQYTKRQVSTAAIGILFIFFPPPHCMFFLPFTCCNIWSTPTWTSFTSHRHLSLSLHWIFTDALASELLQEVLVLNSHTTDSADHLCPKKL